MTLFIDWARPACERALPTAFALLGVALLGGGPVALVALSLLGLAWLKIAAGGYRYRRGLGCGDNKR